MLSISAKLICALAHSKADGSVMLVYHDDQEFSVMRKRIKQQLRFSGLGGM
jgi:hypothetical protein